MSELPTCEIAIVGGTGVYALEGLENVRPLEIDTPFGKSKFLSVGTLFGEDIAFVSRHGPGHKILPSEIPFRANIFAMKKLGVKYLFGVSACGSLREDYHPGDLVMIDQFIDRTKTRESTFFGNGIVGHTEFGHPVCPIFREVATQAVKDAVPEATVHGSGTYVCMEGPCFSTQAESRMYQQWGGHVIGMTALTECKLAREAEIAYCCVGLVTDYDAWKDEGHVDVTSVMAVLKANAEKAQKFTKAVAHALHKSKFESASHKSLAAGLMTKPESVPEEQRIAMRPLYGKYGW